MNLKAISAACALAIFPISGCAAINEIAGSVSGRQLDLPDYSILKGADVDVLAFASISMWQVLQAEAVVVMADTATPTSVRRAIRRADTVGSPLMLELSQLAEIYGAFRLAGRDMDEAEPREVRAQIEALLPLADTNLRLLHASVFTDQDPAWEIAE